MSYAKLAPQPANLQNGEVAVQLDSGALVAVSATSAVDPISNDLVVTAIARAINADGSTAQDDAGQELTTIWCHSSPDYEMTTLGNGDPKAGADVVKKCCMLAVLGEDTSPMWEDAYHMTAMANVNIRVKIQNAAHIGTVNAATLL